MAVLKILDGDGNPQYLDVNGSGTLLAPFIPVHDVTLQDQTTDPVVVKFNR